MTNDKGASPEEFSPLQVFSILHERALAHIEQAKKNWDAAIRLRFSDIIHGSETPGERFIAPGDSAGHALLKAMEILSGEEFGQTISEKAVEFYRTQLETNYENYRDDSRRLMENLRSVLPGHGRMPKSIAAKITFLAQHSVAQCVKESVTSAFPVHPSFKAHLEAPTEHLVLALLMKNPALIAQAQKNLISAYVLDMGYSYELAEAGMQHQNAELTQMIKSAEISGDRPQTLPAAFGLWMAEASRGAAGSNGKHKGIA